MERLETIPLAFIYWGQFVLVTLGLIGLLWLINRALNRLTAGLSRAAEQQQDHAVVQALRSETRLLDLSFFQLLVGLIKWALLLVAIGFYLPLSFTIFPETEQFGRELLVIVFDPLKEAGLGFVAYIPKGADIFITILLTMHRIRAQNLLRDLFEVGMLDDIDVVRVFVWRAAALLQPVPRRFGPVQLLGGEGTVDHDCPLLLVLSQFRIRELHGDLLEEERRGR